MFDPTILGAIRAHAEEDPLVECCGLVTAAGYERVANRAADPAMAFCMGEEEAARIAAGEVLAVVHSHTAAGCDHPSAEDQRQCAAMGIPWGLVLLRADGTAAEPFFWGDGIPDQPLLPRDFRWGPTGTDGKGDCFSLVRDWYRLERGIVLPEFPRDEAWEDEAPMAYMEGWRAQGFTTVDSADLRPGDAVLMSVGSPRRLPNHAAIYLGGEIILHILRNRMAERASYGFLRRSAILHLRPPA